MIATQLAELLARSSSTEIVPIVIETHPEMLDRVIAKVSEYRLDTVSKTYEGVWCRLRDFLPPLPPLPPPPPFLPLPPLPIPPLTPPLPFARLKIPMFNMFNLAVANQDVEIIASIDGVKRIYYDMPMKALQIPLVDMRGWITSEQVWKALGLDRAWAQGYKGKGVKVAVLDTGFQPHSQLPYVESYAVPPFPPYVDENAHGMWCLTHIGGKPWQSPYGKCFGLAPEVKLIAIKVLGYGIGTGSTSGIAKGMELAIQKGADIVNMSLGSKGVSEVDSPLCTIINATKDKIIWCVAAGNEGNAGAGTIGTPGNALNAITVGSWSYLDNARAHFSSMGPTLDGYTKPEIVCYGAGRAVKPSRLKKEYDEYILAGVSWGAVLDGAVDYVKNAVEAMHGTCLPASAKILTTEGEKRIVDVSRGDFVYTFENGNLRTSKVNHLISNGIHDLFRVNLRDRELIATRNHPVLVAERNHKSGVFLKWKTIEELKPDDVMIALRKSPIEKTVHYSKDFCRLLGFMLGDGWITDNKHRTYAICFAQSKYDNLNNKYVSLFKQLFNLNMRLYKKGWWYYCYSKTIGNLLRESGVDGGAYNKKIPEWLFNSSHEHRKEFIDGLVDADGWNVNIGKSKRYAIEMVNEEMIKRLRELIVSVGWKVGQIYSRERVIKAPCSKTPHKQKFFKIEFYKTEFKYGSEKFHPRDIQSLINYNQFILRDVLSISKLGRDHVFDIEIADTHNFIADGVVVHNSMATPSAASVIACAKQKYPDLTTDKLFSIFKAKGHAKNNVSGWGLIRWDWFQD